MLYRRTGLAKSLVLAPAVAANNVTLNPLRKAQEDRLCPQTPPPHARLILLRLDQKVNKDVPLSAVKLNNKTIKLY